METEMCVKTVYAHKTMNFITSALVNMIVV